ncbi:MAG: CCA tRNA nucleotidyltransferase [Tepidisphaeraceae bacterium]
MAASDHAKMHGTRDDALAIVRTLHDAGHVAYFAGGCVRDTVLGLRPKDWDVATDAPPERVRTLFRNTQAVGAAFGVILVRQQRSTIEVATFRSDGTYSDGRRPDSVRFATPQEDARRRDFTINGLFMDPLDDDRVIDFVGGVDDLHRRTLRAIGDPDHRFSEDYLRMLRAVRFAARFQLNIDPATEQAILSNAPKLSRISPERIGDELRATFTAPTRRIARDHLDRLGLLSVLMRHVDPGPMSLDLIAALPADQTIAFPLALAALQLDWLGRSALEGRLVSGLVHAARQSLRLSNDESEHLAQCLDLGPILRAEPPRICTLKRFLAQQFSADAVTLLTAHASIDSYAPIVRERLPTIHELLKTDVAPTPFATGDDLVTLGFKPGPLFKTVLDAVYDAQLEDRVTTRQDAITLAHELMRSASPT